MYRQYTGARLMSDHNHNELITNAINQLTEKLSVELLKEFQNLPKDLQLNIVMIKTGQLLLANILCHVAISKEELEKVINEQGDEIKELTMTCAITGFADKFDLKSH